jgi:hypothetical protein
MALQEMAEKMIYAFLPQDLILSGSQLLKIFTI